jgi:hypothetical protein
VVTKPGLSVCRYLILIIMLLPQTAVLNRKTFNFNGSQTVIKNLDINLVANYILDNSKNRSGLSDGPGNPNNVQFLAPNEAQSILSPGTMQAVANCYGMNEFM